MCPTLPPTLIWCVPRVMLKSLAAWYIVVLPGPGVAPAWKNPDTVSRIPLDTPPQHKNVYILAPRSLSEGMVVGTRNTAARFTPRRTEFTVFGPIKYVTPAP